MAKRVSGHKIKSHNQYTYEQAASALNVSVQTVRSWRDSGLSVLDSQKPHLILGFVLKEFLSKRQAKNKRKLHPEQFLCMTCNAPREAYGGMADYIPSNPTKGRLEALCAVCEGACVKFANPSLCDQLSPFLSIATRDSE